jgi:hypothetical protein
MPSSSVSLEKPRSIAARTETQDVMEHSACRPRAPDRATTPCGFSAGGLRDDLFLPNLSDPDPCIAPRARKQRHASWINEHEETDR